MDAAAATSLEAEKPPYDTQQALDLDETTYLFEIVWLVSDVVV